jgi:translation initiation factor IF-3
MNKTVEYNEKISSGILKVIGSNGQLLGEMTKHEALKIAEELSLDLVVCSPSAIPPVAKLCQIDKYLFEQNKKEKQIKKNTKQMELKKIKIGINIDQNDLKTKLKHAKEFLENGNMVMFFIKLRKKEISKAEAGKLALKKIAEDMSDISTIAKDSILEKTTISLSLRPNKKQKS